MLVTDAGSRNGTTVIGEGTTAPAVAVTCLAPNERLRIGQTMLRIRSGDYVVPDSVPLPVRQRRHPLIILMAFISMLVINLVQDWYLPADEFFERLPSTLVFGTALVVVWSGVWSLVGRAFTRRMDYFEHFIIVCAGYATLILTSNLFNLLTFAFGLDGYLLLCLALFVLIIGEVFYRHLRLFVRSDRWILQSCAMCFAAAIVASPYLFDRMKDKREKNPNERVEQIILPPEFLVTSGVSIDDFIGQIDQAKAQAVKLADKSGNFGK